MSASSSDLELAERAAREAGALLLERFRGPASGVESKSTSTDPVSDADRDAEALLEELLRGERPDDGLLGEEGAGLEGSSGRRWVVDPLDGTVNFLYGHPLWCVSVAVEDAGGGLAGVIFHPPSGELFAAQRGGGATLDGAPMHVRVPASLASTLVATGFAYSAEHRAEQAEVMA
nr:inositol monophosphatase [Thermoleophilaceae bacterium]